MFQGNLSYQLSLVTLSLYAYSYIQMSPTFFFQILTLEDEAIVLSQNIWIQWPIDKASYPRRTNSLATLLWKPQNWHGVMM